MFQQERGEIYANNHDMLIASSTQNAVSIVRVRLSVTQWKQFAKHLYYEVELEIFI